MNEFLSKNQGMISLSSLSETDKSLEKVRIRDTEKCFFYNNTFNIQLRSKLNKHRNMLELSFSRKPRY